MKRIGIDLGTTNTVAAADRAVLPVYAESAAILPSVVAFPPSGVTLVGTAARRRRAIDTKNTVFSAKRLIGRGWHSRAVHEVRSHYPFDLVKTADDGVAFRTRAGIFTPVDIGAVVLSTLIRNVGQDPAGVEAVIAVPSEFQEPERHATAQAARQAGLTAVRIVDEPVAAGFAYLEREQQPIRYAAVYDLGGGTFDLAILDRSRDPFGVVAHGGDLYLGGDDIDHAIASWAADEVLRDRHWDLRSDRVVFDRLVVECERAKIRLCFAGQTRIELAQVDPGGPIATEVIQIDHDVLTRLSNDVVQRTFGICDQVLSRAGIKARDVDAVFLAGGSSKLPLVRESVERYFEKPVRAEYDPMEVVAIGASLVP
jgi:molecular chaperone DnaK